MQARVRVTCFFTLCDMVKVRMDHQLRETVKCSNQSNLESIYSYLMGVRVCCRYGIAARSFEEACRSVWHCSVPVKQIMFAALPARVDCIFGGINSTVGVQAFKHAIIPKYRSIHPLQPFFCAAAGTLIGPHWSAMACSSKDLGKSEGDHGSLAELWEDNRYIRKRLRENDGKLIQWVSPELTGKPTMSSIALNVHALRILAQWWCPTQDSCKSPSVGMLKHEAGWSQLYMFFPFLSPAAHVSRQPAFQCWTLKVPCQVCKLRASMQLPMNPTAIQSDGWALKKLFTYACRKSGSDKDLTSTPKRRDLWLLNYGSMVDSKQGWGKTY